MECSHIVNIFSDEHIGVGSNKIKIRIGKNVAPTRHGRSGRPHYLTGYFITYLTGIGNLGILVQESVGHVGPSGLFLVLVLLLINDLF
jgi:hypothetical protein